ncbi:hypothetical protein [Pseudomonas asplenii]|uniref:hypothetical protein n=1 Tax=Pseudomonas asplenii TaxID=53407 RepID=UPI0012FE2CBF|nr:hypothetical protein [Pseudomonas asplenii]
MDILKKECVGSVTLFDLKVSEGELMVYADCMRVVMEKFEDGEISDMTICESRKEISYFLAEVKKVLREMVCQEFLEDRFKD